MYNSYFITIHYGNDGNDIFYMKNNSNAGQDGRNQLGGSDQLNSQLLGTLSSLSGNLIGGAGAGLLGASGGNAGGNPLSGQGGLGSLGGSAFQQKINAGGNNTLKNNRGG